MLISESPLARHFSLPICTDRCPVLGASIKVFVAATTTDGIYQDGTVLQNIEYGAIAPSSDAELSTDLSMSVDTSLAAILSSGGARIGIRIDIFPQPTVDVPVTLALKRLYLSVSGIPFRLIP